MRVDCWGRAEFARATILICFATLPLIALASDGMGQKLFISAYELQKTGKLSEAATVYEAGLKAEPKNAMAHYFLGDIYAQLGNGAAAKSHLSQSLKLEPQGQYAAKAQERLGRLSEGPAQSPSKPAVPGTVFRDCPDCPEMVVIPAGAFVMGSPPSEVGHRNEESPSHLVTVAHTFALGRTKITRGQFSAFVSETDYQAGGSCSTFEDGKGEVRQGRNWQTPGFQQTDSHPVVCLSWNDAKAYVEWLTRKSGKPYRLPSESEWEYAARAGTITRYYWGESPDLICSHANTMDSKGKADVPGVPWKGVISCSDGYAYTSPVASFDPNAFGLYDMVGNAGEWLEDCFHDGYIGAPTDGGPWFSGECRFRVVRGSSWFFPYESARSARRTVNLPADRFAFNGFRVAKVLP